MNPALKKTLSCFAVANLAVLAFCPEAMAMQEDTMREGLTALEGFLTGNVMRAMVIGGSLYGTYHAFAAQKPGLLLGSVGTGLGVNFLMSWVKSTWAMIV